MNQATGTGFKAIRQPESTLYQYLERLDCRVHRPPFIVVTVDDDALAAWKARSEQLRYIRDRTAMFLVRRQNVHQYVVVRLSVVSHESKHLDLD